jgi:hypothetical protein
MTLLLIMLREVVRVGQLMKEQDALMVRTQGWIDAEKSAGGKLPQTIESDVADGAARQRELSLTGLDIFKQLGPVGGEAQQLPEAVMEAAQFMEGAADSLDAPNPSQALDRQKAAVDFLERAWTVMAMSMSSMAQMEEKSNADPKNETGKTADTTGQGSGTGGNAPAAEAKPWYWELPPQIRDAVSQSSEENFPPEYAPAIKRYYERLSQGDKAKR